MVPTCQTGCAPVLPPVNFDECNPQINLSEVKRAFIGLVAGAPFADWTDAAEWNSRVSNVNTAGANYIRALTVIGDMPAPAERTREISNGRTMVTGRDRTLNLTIDDTSDENYEFIRALECGGKFRVWVETHGGKMLGGNSGMIMQLKAHAVLARGRDEVEVYNVTGTWTAKFSPERTTSPIFQDAEGNGVNSFNTNLVFDVSATPGAVEGVDADAPGVDAEQKFEFNFVAPRVGTNMVMLIEVNQVLRLTVTFTSDYLGAQFRYTDIDGQVYTGTFTNGTVNF